MRYIKYILLTATALLASIQASATIYHETEDVVVPPGLDKVPEVIEKELPQFPSYLRDKGIYSGAAQVVLLVDKEGNPSDIVVIVASHPDVGEAVAAAIREWKFEPPTVQGKPTAIRMMRTEGIATDRAVTRITAMDAFENQQNSRKKNPFLYRIPEANQLDSPLKPAVMVAPDYPESLLAEDAPPSGRAVIDCFVGPDGNVLAPAVDSATHPAFGAAAFVAARQWKFEPIRKDDQPAFTRVKIPFNFSAPNAQEEG